MTRPDRDDMEGMPGEEVDEGTTRELVQDKMSTEQLLRDNADANQRNANDEPGFDDGRLGGSDGEDRQGRDAVAQRERPRLEGDLAVGRRVRPEGVQEQVEGLEDEGPEVGQGVRRRSGRPAPQEPAQGEGRQGELRGVDGHEGACRDTDVVEVLVVGGGDHLGEGLPAEDQRHGDEDCHGHGRPGLVAGQPEPPDHSDQRGSRNGLAAEREDPRKSGGDHEAVGPSGTGHDPVVGEHGEEGHAHGGAARSLGAMGCGAGAKG